MARLVERSILAAAILLICAPLVILQSCAGWGDMFEQKRTVAGPFFLMTSGDGRQPSQYFFFQRGKGGSIAGPIKEIGWDERFVILWDEGSGGEWRIFALDPRRLPIPSDPAERNALFERLRKTVRLHTAQQVWDAGG